MSKRNGLLYRAGLVSGFALLLCQTAWSQTVNWVGGSGDWDTASNWSTGVVPGPTNDVSINTGPAITVTHSVGNDSVNSIISHAALTISGGTLTVATTVQVDNTFSLLNGSLINATIVNGTNGAGLIVSSGVLDNVTVSGTLDAGNTVADVSVMVTNGLTVNGTMLIGNPTNNSYGRVSWVNAGNLAGSGSVVFGNSGNNWLFPGYTNATMTIASNITIHGNSGSVGIGDGPIVNQGKISCDVSGGTITVDGLPLTNQGSLQAINGGILSIAGGWNSTGLLTESGSTLNLGGTFTNVGSVSRTNGTINITGTLNATGTLSLNTPWVLLGGTLHGTTITTSSTFIINSGTFNGVTVNGTLDMGNTVDGATLTVTNGLTLNGTMLAGNPTNSFWGRAEFFGPQTLGGSGTVVFGNSGNNWLYPADTNSAMTIGTGITVHGSTGSVGVGNGPIVNQGAISCDVSAGLITINAIPFTNDGLVQGTNNGSISVSVLQNSGNVIVNGGGTLSLGGGWNNAGTIDATNSIVEFGGTFAVTNLGNFNFSGTAVGITGTLINSNATLALSPTTGSWELTAGGVIVGGSVTMSGGASLIVSGSGVNTLNGVTINGTLDVGNSIDGAGLDITNGLTLNGTMLVGNPTNSDWGRVDFPGTQTLSGSGTVVFGNSGNNWIYPPDTHSLLTIGPGITVHGNTGSVGVGDGPVLNQGTISCDVSSGLITIDAANFTNNGLVEGTNGGSVSITTLQNEAGATVDITGTGALTLGGSWNNAGTIDASNSVANLGGTFNVTNIGTLIPPGGTVNITGTLINTNGFLDLTPAAGSWVLASGGTIIGGSVSISGGASVFVSSGTLNGVSFSGTLDVGNTFDGAGLTVTNGLTVNGTVLMGNPTNAFWGRANFSGSQTLGGTATVVFGNSGNNWLYPPNTNSTMTIGSGVTIQGNTGSIGIGDGPIINQGAINCDVSGGTITIDAIPFFTNEGLVEGTNGGSISITTLQNNAGATVDITGTGALTLGGSWNNAGTIDASNSAVDFNGTFTVTNIGTFNPSGGTVNIIGTLVNTNATLALSPGTGSWVLAGGGTILGGSVTTTPGISLIISSSGILNGVTINGTLDVGNTIDGANLAVTNGLTVNGTMLVGNPTNSFWGRAGFSGSQTLGGTATVIFGNSGNNWLYPPNTNSTMTIGPGVTIRGNTGSVGIGDGPILNQGAISCDVSGGTITIDAIPTFTNAGGLVQGTNGGSISIANLQNIAGGIVMMNGGGSLVLSGSWNNGSGLIDVTNSIVDLSGTFTVANIGVFNPSGGTINITGTLVNTNTTLALSPGTGSWVLASGGAIQGGTVTTSGGTSLIVSASGILNGVTINGTLDVGNTIDGANLAVTNGLTVNGTMLVGNPTNASWGRASFSGSQTLGGGATVVFGNSGNNWIYPPDANSTLTIASGVTIRGSTGSVGVGDGPIINQGAISCDVNGGTVTIYAIPFTNEGQVEGLNGGSIVMSILENDPGATISVTGGSVLTLGSTWTNNGIISSTNSTVNFSGVFSLAALGTFNPSGGTVNITGTLNNTNVTLALTPATGSWVLASGGAIEGGSVTTSGAASLIINNGILNGVTVTGTLDVGNTYDGAALTVTNGLTVNGTVLMGNPTNGSWGRTSFSGPQTLTGTATVAFGNSGNNAISPLNTNSALTIGSGITVRGQYGSIGFGSGSIVSQGIISCDVANGSFQLDGGPFVNLGTVAMPTGIVNVENTANFAGGTLSFGLNGAGIYGHMTGSVPIILGGALVVSLNGGYVPATNASFQLVTSPTNMTGSFTSTNLPSGVTWLVTNSATALTIKAQGTGPTVQFTANQTNGVAPLAIQFTSPATDSSGNTLTAWFWNFGDGIGTSTAQSPSYTYQKPGNYTPSLIVTNVQGAMIVATGPSVSALAGVNFNLTSGALGTPRWFHTATLLPDNQVLAAGGEGSSFALAGAELYNPGSGTWTNTGALNTARGYHNAVLLTNGQVLAAGGLSTTNTTLASAELYNPISGTWANTGPMNTARSSYMATLLPNGQVLAVGGANGTNSLASAELYNPNTGTWAYTGSMSAPRQQATATLLASGEVLVAGGYNATNGYLSSAELYNPGNGTWTVVGAMNFSHGKHTATLLPDGQVLVSGGSSGGAAIANAELYNPTSQTWTNTGALNTGRWYHTATLLPDGLVLVEGGQTNAGGAALSSAELYDPSSGTWTTTSGSLNTPRLGQTATLLPGAQVLIAAGENTVPLASSELALPATNAPPGKWVATGPLNTPRQYFANTLLANGQVLAVGGYNGSQFLASAELYNPSTGTWTDTGSLNVSREDISAIVLTNGDVLVAGGFNATNYLSSAELYNPASQTWAFTGALSALRRYSAMTLLTNGEVLLAGGYNGTNDLSTAELYNPNTGLWADVGAMNTNRTRTTLTLLTNGMVLVAGGASEAGYLASAELYNPVTQTWTFTGSMNVPRWDHTATLLPNGEVLVAGGTNNTGDLADAELYNPQTGQWTVTAPMTSPRDLASAALLPNGDVLVSGGENGAGPALATSELYNPATATWTSTGALTTGLWWQSSTLLANGRVLIEGGSTNGGTPVANSELYDVGLGFSPSSQPQIFSVNPAALTPGLSLQLSGTLFQGFSEASGGNGSQNSPGNYPLVQLQSIANGQTLYLSPQNWGSASFSSVPIGFFPPGPAYAAVFANGIPSAASIVNVTTPFTGATLQYAANPTNGPVPLTVTFSSPPADSTGVAITSWNWTFGDGVGTSIAQNPSYTYTNAGNFAPTLIATNFLGETIFATGPSISVAPGATPVFSISPSSIGSTYTNKVTIQITNLPGGSAVVVQKYLDLNSNGIVDSGDLLFQQYQVTDGQGPTIIGGVTNFQIPWDLNPTNGDVTLMFDPHFGGGEQALTGQFLYVISSPTGAFNPVTNAFNVTNDPTLLQTISGTVFSNGVPVPHSIVWLSAPPTSGNQFYSLGGTIADVSGNYSVKVPVGTYKLIAWASNCLGNLGTGPVVTLSVDQFLSTNLFVSNATETISGTLTDATNAGIKLPGVVVASVIKNGPIGFGATDSNGNFTLPAIPGQFGIGIEPLALGLHGYVGLDDEVIVDSTGGSVSGVAIGLTKETSLIYGSITDPSGNPLPDVRIDGQNGNSGTGIYQSSGSTDLAGNYIIGVVAGNWSPIINNKNPLLSGYDFSTGPVWTYPNGGPGSNIVAGIAVQANFSTVATVDTITGSVIAETGGVPIAGVGVFATANINGTNYDVETDTDTNGDYSLNAAAGTWDVSINCTNGSDGLQSFGYQCVSDVQAIVAAGFGGIANFSPQQAFVYTANKTSGSFPLTVQFTGPAVDPNGYNITSWSWNFEDSTGVTNGTQSPSYTFDFPGIFAPSLFASNSIDGNQSVSGPLITVTGGTQPPSIVEYSDTPQLTVGETGLFAVDSVVGSTPLSFQWYFDGTKIPGATSMIYDLTNASVTNTGSYVVIVTNAYGGYTNAAINVVVSAGEGSCVSAPPGIINWWRGEDDVHDSVGGNNGIAEGELGFTAGEVGQAFSFDGQTAFVGTSMEVTNPQEFSISMWFNTTTTNGGALIGFDDSQLGNPLNYDRTIYMENTGFLHFGVQGDGPITVDSPFTYNDGAWHYLVVTIDTNNGAAMYVDGELVASNADETMGEDFNGWWRIGESELNSCCWPFVPNSLYFQGDIDEISIFNGIVDSDEIASIYDAGSGGMCFPVPLFVSWPTPNSMPFGTPLGTNQLDATASIPGSFAYFPTNGSILPVGSNTLTAVFTPADTIDYPVTTNTASINVIFQGQATNAVVFVDSQSGDSWDASDESQLNTAFGTNWQNEFYETLNPSILFSPATSYIFMEGGDDNALAMANFLNANLTLMQNWVLAGGSLFLNAAPNQGGNMNWGFGVTLNFNIGGSSNYDSDAAAVIPAFPIFNGPFTPVGTSWTGGYFAHAYITGPNLTPLIINTANGLSVLSEGSYGAGHVLFGGMTVPEYHSPEPQGNNLLANILSFGAAGGAPGTFTQFSATPTNGFAPLAVQFTSPSVDSASNTIVSWYWSFGDGVGHSTNQNPSYTYTNIGNYFPTFIGTNSLGSNVYGNGPSITVTVPPLTLSWVPTPGTIVYGSSLTVSQLDAVASVAGSYVYNPPLGTVLGVGAHVVSLTFNPSDTVDYGPVTTNVSITVTPAPLSVVVASTNWLVGQPFPTFTGTITGLTNGDVITATYSSRGTPASLPGTYPIFPTLQDPGHKLPDYAVTLVDGTLSISAGVIITSPNNGSSFTTNQGFTVNAIADLTNGLASLALYTNGTLVLSVGSSNLSAVLTNLAPGSYALTAVATPTSGTAVTSPVVAVTVNIPGTSLVNFDALDTSRGVMNASALSSYLAGYGIVATNLTFGTSLEALTGAQAMQQSASHAEMPVASSAPNLFTQTGSSQPLTYTLNFAGPLQSVGFTRVGLLTNGLPTISHPGWSALALDPNGNVLETVTEPLLVSSNNIPARTFTLVGPNIASVRFNSDSQGGTAAFAAVLLDDLFLNSNVVANPLSIGLAQPVGGTAPDNIQLTATASDGTADIAYVAFYSGPTLIGVATNGTAGQYSLTWSNVLNGTFNLTAQLVDQAGFALASTPVSVTVQPGGSSTVVNFDAVSAVNGPVTGAGLSNYLAQSSTNGVTSTNGSPGTQVAIENQANVAGGNFVAASSPPNILSQIGSNGPVNFTVNFTNTLSQFAFTRPQLLASPYVTHPAWTAQAFDALGQPLASTSAAAIASATNVPAQTYVLSNSAAGGGIASVQFSSQGSGLTAVNAVLLDDFILTALGGLPPAVQISEPDPGSVFTDLLNITLGASATTASGTVTGVAFYYNGTNLAGSSESAPFTISWNAPANGTYLLTAVATNSSGLVSTSAPVTFSANNTFAIVASPTNLTVGVSNTAAFSVTVSPVDNVSYQWFSNNAPISGATASNYTVPALADAVPQTNTYSVSASREGLTLSGSNAVLTVLGPPTIDPASIQPGTNVAIAAGTNVTLSISASPPVFYQWQRNGQFILGATNNSYTISNAQPADSGDYQVLVANAVASQESPTFAVAVSFGGGGNQSVNTTFATSQAVSLTNGPVGGDNSISPASGQIAVIAGKPASHLLWYNWTANFTGVVTLSTLGSSFDTLLGVYTGDAPGDLATIAEDDDSGGYFTSQLSFNCTTGTTYQFVVAGYKGASGHIVLQSPNYLILDPNYLDTEEPQITGQPTNQLVTLGQDVTLSVAAANATTYQWYFAGAPIPGANDASLAISNFPASAVGNYYALAANDVGSVQSQTAVVELTTNSSDTLVVDKFGDAVDLTSGLSQARYHRADAGGETGGFTLSQSFSTVGATKEKNEPNHAGQPGGASYWYSFTSPGNGLLSFDTKGSLFNTILAIYTGPGNSFNTLVSAGAAFTTNYLTQGQPVVVVSNATVGVKYFIAIDGFGGASGAAKLNVLFTATSSVHAPAQTNIGTVLSISAPANNSLVTSPSLALRGTVRSLDQGQLPQISYVQIILANTNGITTNHAALGKTNFSDVLMPGPGGIEEAVSQLSVSWSSNLTLLPGANIITCQSFDTNGQTNVSLPVTHTVFYVSALPSKAVTSTLTISAAPTGHGKIVSGPATGALLEINKVYTATAAPVGNWIFTNWTSGTNASSLTPLAGTDKLTFLMTSNLVLQANFVTNPFSPLAGVYNGLFAPATGVTEASSGYFTATLPASGRGTYSARLVLDGASYPFSSSFDLTGNSGLTLNGPGGQPLTVQLQLDLAGAGPITGTVSNSAPTNGWSANLLANRAAGANTNYTGHYTLVLPPGAGAPTNEPGGNSYATLTSSTGGHVTVNGHLADGVAFSQSVPVATNGQVPVFALLYNRHGSFQGWLAITNTTNAIEAVVGTGLAWIKNTAATSFTNTNLAALGSYYLPPKDGQAALNLTNGTLTLSNTTTGTALVYSNVVLTGNKLSNNDPSAPVTGQINPANGNLTFTFHPETGKTTTAKGVLLQNQPATNASGFFLDGEQSGFFLLQP
jgi:hypothetical protein